MSAFDRRVLLQALGDNVILPLYAQLAERAGALDREALSFCEATDSAGLVRVQDAWSETRAPLKRAEAFSFGPYKEYPQRLGPLLDFWPARPDQILGVLDDENAFPVLDTEVVSTLGAARKGTPVIEYLLYASASDDNTVLAVFSDPEEGPRRCNYLTGLTADLVVQASALHEAWNPSGGNYLGQLVDAGTASSTTFPSVQAAFSEVFNRISYGIENAYELKIGKPFGKRGVKDVEQAESAYSGRSVGDIIDNLIGIEALYSGEYGERSGLGIADFLRTRSRALDAEFMQKLSAAREALDGIPVPLTMAVFEHETEVQEAYDALLALHRLMTVDVANALSITITFNDTDGD